MQAPAGVPNLYGVKGMAGEQTVRAHPRSAVVSAFHRFGFLNLVGEDDEQAMMGGHGRTPFLARHHLDRRRWSDEILRASTLTTRRFGGGVESIRALRPFLRSRRIKRSSAHR